MKVINKAVLLIFFMALSAQRTESVCERGHSFSREVDNFHVVAPGIMRGSQPNEKSLAVLADCYGTKTVLDLRDEKDNIQWEKDVVERLGMKFISVPMNGGRRQSLETINKAISAIADKANHPVFVHCAAGKDRTGLVFAAYRIKHDNWSFSEALDEMLIYGYDRSCCRQMEESLREWAGKY